jgi:multiple sugar transport system substrate-binding protein
MKKFFIFLWILSLGVFFVSCEKNSDGENVIEVPNEIRVLLPEHPYANILISLIPEFESETGIKVSYEQVNENRLSEIQVNAIENDTFTADVFMTRPSTEALLFLKSDWVAPLNDYDFSDYPTNMVEIGVKDGVPHIVPLLAEWYTLFYRKDLFEAAGLDVPTDFDELEEAARILNKDGVAGFASRGSGFAAVSQLSSFIYNFGGRYIKDGTAAFDSPEALDAVRFYGRILSVYGPNGISTMSWGEILPLFQAGQLAMWADASVFFGQLIDPEVSVVPAENVGVAKFPRGPVADQPYIVTAWGMAISSATENFDSSMEFLRWATSRAMAMRAAQENITMARLSVWEDPAVAAHIHPEIADTMRHASRYGYPYAMPFMTSIFQARELIGEVISESINTGGTSPRLQALATQKVSQINDLLKADGEYGIAK